MSSIIAFLSAVGRRVEFDMGDLAHLETIRESDRYFVITDEVFGTGSRHKIPIAAGRKFILISAAVVPVGAPSTSDYCYVDLQYGGTRFDRLFYDYRQDSGIKTRDATYAHFLNGDGVREVDLVVTSQSGAKSQVICMGYYAASESSTAGAVRNLRADEQSPDVIRLQWDAPLDNGGNAIVAYRIRRGDTVDAAGMVTNYANIHDLLISPGQSETAITYDDGNLADNTTYYYQVIPITQIAGTNTLGAPSQTVSATTETDHPAAVTGFELSPISSTQIRLEWDEVSDSGGVPLTGYQIQRVESNTDLNLQSIPVSQVDTVLGRAGLSFADLVANTGLVTTYRDGTLQAGNFYYYRIRALNSDSKSSLQWSPIITTTTSFTAPTNLRGQTSHDAVSLFWSPPSDVGGNTIAGYRIERSTDNTNFGVINANTGTSRTNYTDEAPSGNRVYYYRVRVIANNVIGPASTSVRVAVPARPPSAPRLSVGTVTSGAINLSWTAPASNGGLALTGYVLQRSKNIGFPDGDGDPQTFVRTRNPGATIDGSAPFNDRMSLGSSASFTIARVEVEVNISHVHRGDVEITLRAPNGNTYVLKQVDYSDTVDNITETYGGDIFNDLIGLNSEGTWTITVHDRWEPLDDGTFNSWTLRIVRATEPLTRINLASNIRTYRDESLDAETQYFYRILARNNVEDGSFSNIVNATTAADIFGNGSDGDLEVAEDTIMQISGNKQYANITINDGGVLEVSDSLLRFNGVYTAHGTGKIKVPNLGCAGGDGGVTAGGIGGKRRTPLTYTWNGGSYIINPHDAVRYDPVTDRVSRRSSDQPHLSPTAVVRPVLTPPTIAPNCTSGSALNNLLPVAFNVPEFDRRFANSIMGTKGSDGTPAQPSGAGGAAGSRRDQRPIRSVVSRQNVVLQGFASGGSGGDGGTGAQGADGVRGGGKFALVGKSFASPLLVDAVGNPGNNGNQGTAQPGTSGEAGGLRAGGRAAAFDGSAVGAVSGTRGANGQAASANGTLGSAGGAGGIVYVIYDELLAAMGGPEPVNDTFDTTIDPWIHHNAGTGTNTLTVSADSKLRWLASGNNPSTSYIQREFDVPTTGADESLFLHFLYSYHRAFNVSSLLSHMAISNADTGAVLYTANLIVGGNNNFSVDLKSILNGATRIRIRFNRNAYNGQSTSWWSVLFLDNFRLEVAGVVPDGRGGTTTGGRVSAEDIDVSGGQGGFNGSQAGAATELLTTRAADGAEGHVIIARTTDL